MIWIGGGPGAGKSTLSWLLARAHDLPLHQIDLWAYDHQARLAVSGSGSIDAELAQGPATAADAFEASSGRRLPLVLSDIAARDLGTVPVIIEGPQLTPESAAGLAPGWCVWLLPDPARTRKVREERAARQAALGADPAARRTRAELLAERDELLTSRICATAARLGRPVVSVPPDPDWSAIFAAVESALAPALSAAPRLAPGLELRRQRRYENAIAVRQGRLWAQADGLTALPPYPYGCECGSSGCRALWRATPDEYAAKTASDQPLIAHDRQDLRQDGQ